MMNLKGSGRGLILSYYPGIRWRMSKTTQNLTQDSWFSGLDFNLGPPEYEAGMLNIRPRRSVERFN
jgi:hypothetical protein